MSNTGTNFHGATGMDKREDIELRNARKVSSLSAEEIFNSEIKEI